MAKYIPLFPSTYSYHVFIERCFPYFSLEGKERWIPPSHRDKLAYFIILIQ